MKFERGLHPKHPHGFPGRCVGIFSYSFLGEKGKSWHHIFTFFASYHLVDINLLSCSLTWLIDCCLTPQINNCCGRCHEIPCRTTETAAVTAVVKITLRHWHLLTNTGHNCALEERQRCPNISAARLLQPWKLQHHRIISFCLFKDCLIIRFRNLIYWYDYSAIHVQRVNVQLPIQEQTLTTYVVFFTSWQHASCLSVEAIF